MVGVKLDTRTTKKEQTANNLHSTCIYPFIVKKTLTNNESITVTMTAQNILQFPLLRSCQMLAARTRPRAATLLVRQGKNLIVAFATTTATDLVDRDTRTTMPSTTRPPLHQHGGILHARDVFFADLDSVSKHWQDKLFPISLPVDRNVKSMHWIPQDVKVTERNTYYEIVVNVPAGIQPADLKMELESNGIFVHVYGQQGVEYYHTLDDKNNEKDPPCHFTKRFTLDTNVDTRHMQARFCHGRLVILAPKIDKDSPNMVRFKRQIPIVIDEFLHTFPSVDELLRTYSDEWH